MSRILIVDDMFTLRRVIEIYLSGAGHTFEHAGTGLEALSAMAARPPDLVVSDLKMPDMDGAALCTAMRANEALCEIPVILISSAEATELAAGAGAFAFVKKPLDADQLVETVNRALASRAPAS